MIAANSIVFDAQLVATILAALITSGFFYGGVKFLFRSRAESGAIIVKSAEGVVILQATIIKELRHENEKLKSEINELRAKVDGLGEKVESCGAHIDKLENSNQQG